jgi:hypothetical protein
MNSIRLPKSKEEHTAEKISNLINDLTLDIEQVGIYLARTQPRTILRRFMIIADTAEDEINVGR